MIAKEMPRSRSNSPFDPTAKARLRRMGLLREDGTPDLDAVSVLCRVFAAQFYFELWDAYQGAEAVREAADALFREAEQGDAKRRFLAICLQYDAIYRPLPDPMWWASGDLALADAWSSAFMARLAELLKGGEQDAEC